MKTNTVLLYTVAALIIGGGVMAITPRGIRNKNPGNIRHNPANDWVGQVGVDDQNYVIFDKTANGIRAMGRVLKSYHTRHDLNSILEVIYRWAPPGDNNPTASYARFVADRLGVQTTTPLNFETQLPALIEAIIKHENGIVPYTDKFIEDSLDLP